MLGVYEMDTKTLPDYLQFIAGFSDAGSIRVHLLKIIRFNERQTVRIGMVNVVPTYAMQEIASSPSWFTAGSKIYTARPDLKREEDDDYFIYPPGTYRGFVDED